MSYARGARPGARARSPEAEQWIKLHYIDKGLSADRTASLFNLEFAGREKGVTRCGVVSLAHREGWNKSADDSSRSRQRIVKQKRAAALVEQVSTAPAATPQAPTPIAKHRSRRFSVPLWQLALQGPERQCRWPVGEDPGPGRMDQQLMCGDPVEDPEALGCIYCKGHRPLGGPKGARTAKSTGARHCVT